MTHGQIGEYIGKVANLMIDWGVKPGDHVALSSYNHINYFVVQLGIMAAGGRVALCNPAYPGYTIFGELGIFFTNTLGLLNRTASVYIRLFSF